jgi:pimeloyl-ACP methyl ester carboxylesterase
VQHPDPIRPAAPRGAVRRPALAVLALAALTASLLVPPSPAGAAPAGAFTPGTVVAGSSLSGPGAFLGPVRQVPVDGIRIGYRQFGSGPSLLMVVGDTAPMSLWTLNLLGALDTRFRVTIFDNRGVGYSTDDVAVPLTVPLMARDTVGLIRALRLRRPTLLGWSMGGEIGLTVAALSPGVLGRLVTTGGDTGGPHADAGSPAIQEELNDPATTPTQFLGLIFPPSAGAAKAAFVQQYLLVPQENVSTTTLIRQGQAEAAWYRFNGTWARLPSVRIPVLVTQGSLDVVNPPVNARVIASRVRGAKVVLFAGAGHAMLFQSWQSFAALVARFAA